MTEPASLIATLWQQIVGLGTARLQAARGDLALLVGIGLCLAGAAGFGLSALHGLLRPLVGAVGASGLLACGLTILALALALWRSERQHARTRHAPFAAAPTPPPLPDPATDPAPNPAANPATTAAFVAGFLLARRVF